MRSARRIHVHMVISTRRYIRTRNYVHAYTQAGHSSRRKTAQCEYTRWASQCISYEPLLPSVIRRTHTQLVAFFLRSFLFFFLSFVSFFLSSRFSLFRFFFLFRFWFPIRLRASAFEIASLVSICIYVHIYIYMYM